MFNKKYVKYFFSSGQSRVLMLIGIIWFGFLAVAAYAGDPLWIQMGLWYIGIFLLAYTGTWIYWKNARLD